jgi:hypothetical protein
MYCGHFLVLFSLYLVIYLLLLYIIQLFAAKHLKSNPTQLWKENNILPNKNTTNREAINLNVLGNHTWEHYSGIRARFSLVVGTQEEHYTISNQITPDNR